tara:strand:- start:41 stop:985 length:945 start_codon:yes stop_codon:yes gene_type:complete
LISELKTLLHQLKKMGHYEAAEAVEELADEYDEHEEYDDIQEDYDQPVAEYDELEYIEQEEDSAEKFFGSWINSLPEASKKISENKIHWKRNYDSEVKEGDLLHEFGWAGSGAHRIALYPKSSPNYIAKFARSVRGAKMNKSEFDKQQDFKGLFPEVYAHGAGAIGTDFDWVVIERANVITTDEEISNFFPEIVSEYENMSKSNQVGMQTALKYLLQIEVANNDLPDEDMNSRQHQVEGFKKIFNESPRWWLEDLKSNQLFSKLVAISKELGVDVDDLGVGNLGVNNKGELVIIDASLHEDFSTSEKDFIESLY